MVRFKLLSAAVQKKRENVSPGPTPLSTTQSSLVIQNSVWSVSLLMIHYKFTAACLQYVFKLVTELERSSCAILTLLKQRPLWYQTLKSHKSQDFFHN